MQEDATLAELIDALWRAGQQPGRRSMPMRFEPFECTEISANWCPIHGDCACRDRDDLNDDDCPLHSGSSSHGERQYFETLWGLVPVGDA